MTSFVRLHTVSLESAEGTWSVKPTSDTYVRPEHVVSVLDVKFAPVVGPVCEVRLLSGPYFYVAMSAEEMVVKLDRRERTK